MEKKSLGKRSWKGSKRGLSKTWGGTKKTAYFLSLFFNIKKKRTHLIIAVLTFLVAYTVLNTLANIIMGTIQSFMDTDSFLDAPDFNLTLSNTLFQFAKMPSFFHVVLMLIAAIAAGVVLFKLYNNFRELEESGLKGTSRFTTLDELQKQYKSVPEKKYSYKGGGGVPISRYKDEIFIDDSPVNNLWVGTTRSGKGEMGMFPMIDIYSRAEAQASMVLNDPKGELFAASKETLEERGYHVEVLNLDNPMQSMSYQLLQIVVDAYEEGDMAKAEQYTKTITSMLYSDPEAKDKFWQDSASALVAGIILGLCEKNIPDNKQKITMYSVANTLNELASDKYTSDTTEEQRTGLDDFFDSLPTNHPAKLQYATVKFASGAGQTVAGIFANAFDKLSIFTLTPIAKMTSQNSFDMKKIGFGKVISGKAIPLSRVTIYFGKKKETVQTGENGLFTLYHDFTVNPDDIVTIEVKDKKNNDTYNRKVQVQEIKKEDIKPQEQDSEQHHEEKQAHHRLGEVIFKDVSEDTHYPENITIQQFEHFNKPTALFMITPDYDPSLHIIASLYVKQLYTELSRAASNTRSGKCIREVIFILDEFGNMPVIDNMGNMITVCLGRNIRFNLVVQAYSQLERNYEKDWETIDGNCANTIYILTTNYDTAEKISKKLGEKTVSSTSRSGSTLSIDKSKTEGVEGRNLLTANELMQLKEGEMVVVRGIKRQDNERRKIIPYPIFDTGETRMKYRFEYLADWFDDNKSINDFDIRCLHADTNLNTLAYRFKEEDQKQQEETEEQPEETNNQEQENSNTIKNVMGHDNKMIDIITNETGLALSHIEGMSVPEFVSNMNAWKEEQILNEEFHKSVLQSLERQLGGSVAEFTGEQDTQEITIEQKFEGWESQLNLIKKKLLPHMEETEEEFLQMSVSLLFHKVMELQEERDVPENIYDFVKGTIDDIEETTETEDEQEEIASG